MSFGRDTDLPEQLLKASLPELPDKANVSLDHLAFREPGRDASKRRLESLEHELLKQKQKLEGLKQEQEELRKQCRKELDMVRRESLQVRSQQEEFQELTEDIRGQFKETVRELELATGQEEDEETREGKRIQKLLAITEAAIEKQKQAVELEELEENDLGRIQAKVQNNIDKLTQESTTGGETGVEDGIENGVETGRENGGETGGETEVETGGENGVENGVETGGETEGEKREERGQNQKREQQELQELQELQEQQGRLTEQNQELERQRKRRRERKLQDLKLKLKELKENKAERTRQRLQADKELKRLQRRQKQLKDNQIALRKQQRVDHEQEEQERQRQEQEQETQRKSELLRQRGREQRLNTLRLALRDAQFYLTRRRLRGDLDSFEVDEDPMQGQELEEILKKVATLEAKLTEVLRLKQKLEQAQDLQLALEREKHSEEMLLEPSKQDSVSYQGKDHLSGNDLKIYKPLKEDQIRLLILWPAPMDCYPLICTLRTESLKQYPKPKYAALSYFWGTDSPEARLYLLPREPPPDSLDQNNWGHAAKHAMRIRIRNNLFRALLRLRREKVPVALWVDVMCINQEDKDEKTEQLRKMANVYQMAENVCIWLGEADSKERSNDAMDFIPKIMDFAVLDTLAKDKEQAKKWYALSELMRDRWFSRRWVVQEISLANSASVHCGAKSVQWADFVDAVSILVSNQARIKTLFDFSAWREGPETMGEVKSFGAYILLEETSRLFLRTEDGDIVKPIKSLESLVTSLKTFDTSDERDIIYSLVSIASDTYKLSQSYYTRRDDEAKEKIDLPVDYNRSEIDVYTDFTKFCINSSKSLDIICRHWAMPVKKKGNEKEGDVTLELPSWIPLLSDSEYGEPELVYGGRKNGDNLVGPVGRPRYNASGDTKPEVRCGPEGENDANGQNCTPPGAQKDGNEFRTDAIPKPPSSLCAKGFRLAKIEKVSLRNTAGLVLGESIQMGGWTGIKNNRESVPDKIWRTLIADRDPEGQIPPTWYKRACLRCLEMADTFNNGDLNIGQLLKGNSDMLRVYLTRVRDTIWNRKFFTAKIRKRAENNLQNGVAYNHLLEATREGPEVGDTQEGTKDNKLFGLCPGTTKEGDLICILYGCSVPVILRERRPGSPGKWFRVIGEAYVHGKMDGEAIADYKNGLTLGEEEEDFDLQ